MKSLSKYFHDLNTYVISGNLFNIILLNTNYCLEFYKTMFIKSLIQKLKKIFINLIFMLAYLCYGNSSYLLC